MNLALLTHEEDIPEYVRVNALRIAIRIMLQTETLDFFMDPQVRVCMGQNGAKKMNNEFSWRRVAERTVLACTQG